MSDLIRREDAYKIAKKVVEAISDKQYSKCLLAYDIMDWIDDLPAVDAVEVVRCRECIHRKKYQDDEQQGDTICTLEWKMKKLDWYCADGQRREDGDA